MTLQRDPAALVHAPGVRMADLPPTLLWLVGAPGVGKTSLTRALLEPDPYLVPAPKWTVGRHTCAVGHYTGATFDGGDTLSYTGAAPALEYWRAHLLGPTMTLTMLDGDRTSSAAMRSLVLGYQGVRLRCVHLTAPEATIAAQCAGRGSAQNATWAKGRATKSARFAEGFTAADRLLVHATGATPAELGGEVLRWLAT